MRPGRSCDGQVLRKLNAAKGGGYIFQSDHSVPSNVSGERYQYVIELVRTHGAYPLSARRVRRIRHGEGPDA